MLSREQVVDTAIDLLDSGGEGALTVRAMTARLATGSGAVYHHVGSRDELLAAATETVVTAALTTGSALVAATPEDEVRRVALALFDAVAEHRWLAARLAPQVVRNPAGPVAVEVFERLGRQVGALGVPPASWFDATATLVHYVLGAVSRDTRVGGDTPGGRRDADREGFFDAVSTAWRGLDVEDHPFLHAAVDQAGDHDDRERFLTGIGIVLDGLTHLRRPARPGPPASPGGLPHA